MALFGWLTFAAPGRADEGSAKELFKRGNAAFAEMSWQEAAELFEASLAESDRPASRFNLMLAYVELHRPLEVVRQALAFLKYPERPTHAAARQRARDLLSTASGELAILETELLPPSAVLTLNGAPPEVHDEARIYLSPGTYQLQLRVSSGAVEEVTLHLDAGQVCHWPRVRAPDAEAPPTPAPAVQLAPPRLHPAPDVASKPSRRRAHYSWTLAAAGAGLELSALGVYFGALHGASEVRGSEATDSGFLSLADRYERLRLSVTPLALVGGAFMTGAVALGRPRRRLRLPWLVGALAAGAVMAGAGIILLVQEPGRIEGTSLHEPRREGGALLLSNALPLLTFGSLSLIGRFGRGLPPDPSP